MTMQNGVWTGGLHTLRCRFETTYSTATTLDPISFHLTCFHPFCTKEPDAPLGSVTGSSLPEHIVALWVKISLTPSYNLSCSPCGPLQ